MSVRRLALSIFGVMLVALVFSSAPALAAPEAPETGKASGVTATSALLGGVLNPHAAGEAGVYYFAYAPRGLACTEYGYTAEAASAGFEKELVEPPVEVAGLEPSTLYTICLIDRNEAGEATVGSSETFTTPAAPPAVEGETTSGVTSTAATLEGQVNPNNQVTSCEIQYGTTTSYGTSAPCEPASLEGFGDQRAALPVTGLEAGTTYHFRIVAENASKEKKEGADQAFTTVPTPSTDPVSDISAKTATFNGHLTLNTVDTTYSFEYKVGTECPGESTTPSEDAGSGSGTLASPSTAVTGLVPATQYAVCFVTSNSFGSEQGETVTFTTPAAEPSSTGESVTDVTATSARLRAEVNPGGAETTYHFEYGTTTAYGQSTSESAPVGSDNSEHPAAAEIQGLSPITIYHYRIVATNLSAPAGAPGSDETFTTQSAGGESSLPDGRAYELVSPVDKEDGEVLGIGGGGITPAGGDATQSSEDGRSVSYTTSASVGVNPPGNFLSSQLFSSRGAGGWSTQNISIPHPIPVDLDKLLSEGEEFIRFSSDLGHAIVRSPHEQPEPPLAPEIHQEVAGGEPSPGSGQEIYVRNNGSGVFRAVQTVEPLPDIVFEGASPDLSHVVFEGPAGLDPEYPLAGGLYEWTDGQTRLVSVLPGPGDEPTSGSLGDNGRNNVGGVLLYPTLHAVSDDGSRVVWAGVGGLYSREMRKGETTLIGPGLFQGASSDGSRVFYLNNGELFVFDVLAKTQVDLGAASSVVGANEEGTVVYDTSPAVLPGVTSNGYGDAASNGANNLYMLHETSQGSGSWSPTFITSGAEEGTATGLINEAPFATREMRVSPNGDYLSFMSQQRLTTYDNRDANSGMPDEEVYLFDGRANSLVCASCDPTGARPVGEYNATKLEFLQPRIDPFGIWEGHWIAATIPGWTPDGANDSTGYQPRFLSDTGRLFFDSTGALVSQDVNGRDDVYQYEPVGVGSCKAPGFGLSASTVRDLSGSGCVGLISAGTGSDDSLFFDTSANGNDVFFTTQDGLASQDHDGAADLYDARVCTTVEPCVPGLASPPACGTADSCRVAPSPQPGVFAAPASATFEGAGNITPAVTNGVEAKSRTRAIRAREFANALKACRKRSRRRRVVCEAKARKLYGPAKTSGRRGK
jgi:hypothetical protein